MLEEAVVAVAVAAALVTTDEVRAEEVTTASLALEAALNTSDAEAVAEAEVATDETARPQ